MRKSKDVNAPAASRILLVDDNRNGLLARKSVLEEHGFQVDAYTNSEEALSALQHGAYQLVITDYNTPKMIGTELIRRVREAGTPTQIILLSGMVDPLGLNEKNTGADAVVAKSANELAYLLRAVNRLLRPAVKKPASSQAAKRARKTLP